MTALSFVLSHLVHAPCFLCPTAVAILLQGDEFLPKPFFFCLLWIPAFPFATVPIIYFITKADSAFSTAIFAFHFRPVIREGWAFFTIGSRGSRHIWKSRALLNLNFSTSDNVGSFSFVDELYSTTFVMELDTPGHFFVYLLIIYIYIYMCVCVCFVLCFYQITQHFLINFFFRENILHHVFSNL